MVASALADNKDLYKELFFVPVIASGRPARVTFSENYSKDVAFETGAPRKLKAVVSIGDRNWVFVSDHNSGMFVPDFFTNRRTVETRNFFPSFTPRNVPSTMADIKELTTQDDWKLALHALAAFGKDYFKGGDNLKEASSLARATSEAYLAGGKAR